MAQQRKFAHPDELVHAAARLFEERGYANTTIDEIAVSAGVTKPTVYRYVKSKAALLERVFSMLLDRLTEEQQAVLAATDDPVAQLAGIIDLWASAVTDLATNFRIFFDAEKELRPAARRRFRQWTREFVGEFEGVLRRCADAGLVSDAVDPKLASFLITGMLSSVARWYEGSGPLGPETLADQALALLGGFLTPAGKRRLVRARNAPARQRASEPLLN